MLAGSVGCVHGTNNSIPLMKGNVAAATGSRAFHPDPSVALRRSVMLTYVASRSICHAHKEGKGYKAVSKQFRVPVATKQSIIRKYKQFHTVKKH